MVSVSDRILERMRGAKTGSEVFTPKDFLDFGSRNAIDQALSRLARSRTIRRVARGFYDIPRVNEVAKRQVPADPKSIAAALSRRDGIRILPDNLSAANNLGLTTAVSGRLRFQIDGPPKRVVIGNRTIEFVRGKSRVFGWYDSPARNAVMALLWMGEESSRNKRTVATLRRNLSPDAKADLIERKSLLPNWAVPIAMEAAA